MPHISERRKVTLRVWYVCSPACLPPCAFHACVNAVCIPLDFSCQAPYRMGGPTPSGSTVSMYTPALTSTTAPPLLVGPLESVDSVESSGRNSLRSPLASYAQPFSAIMPSPSAPALSCSLFSPSRRCFMCLLRPGTCAFPPRVECVRRRDADLPQSVEIAGNTVQAQL